MTLITVLNTEINSLFKYLKKPSQSAIKNSMIRPSASLHASANTTATATTISTTNNQIHSQRPPVCQYPNCVTNSRPHQNREDLRYKSCHYCYTFYCSRECRQLDWCEHKNFKCMYGRLSSYCKKILTKVGRQCLELRAEISKLSRAAYVSTCETLAQLGIPILARSFRLL